MNDAYAQAGGLLKAARALFVLTGAGISAESGIPTFRGPDGLWKNYAAADLATPEAFRRDPELVWEWYEWRQSIIRKARPNPAHEALAALEKMSASFFLLTQNVDGLHRRAGSVKVFELHGNIFRTRCVACGALADYRPGEPRFCPCGGRLRPDIVWFGESIPAPVWEAALAFLERCDTVLVCGTSGTVWPAALVPPIARRYGSKIIEINLEATPISKTVDLSLLGKAGDILPEIMKFLL